ncbi:MAG: T9SS type A sorting domain-containing protein [Candidatus Latescibacteria bacterium]|nr:T9SS type A sorting domain-containing protein [Candidatus Latescibacterota bacterium]
MKRFTVIALATALVLVMAASAMARPTGPAERIYQRLGSEVLRDQAAQPNVSVREDTLFLFAASGDGSFGSPGTDDRGFTFDYNGDCAAAGWYGHDKTSQEGNWWHLEDAHIVDGHATDMSGAGQPWTPGGGPNDYAFWCGRQDVCGWAHSDGYGNNWDQYLVIESADFADSLNLNFVMNGYYEGDVWDHFQVFIDVDGVNEEIYDNQNSAEAVLVQVNLTVLATDFPGGTFGDLTMRFSTDGAWSDEDGLFTSDIGAVWIDNVELVRDDVTIFQYDFEDGIAPTEFTPTAPPGVGDFADLYQGLFTEDICVTNVTCAWAFFDLNTTNPEYPIPVTIYGPPYLDNDVRSPVLESAHPAGDPSGQSVVVSADTQVWLTYWVYYDLPQNALIYQSWGVAAQVVGSPCLGVYKNDNTVYFGDDKQWFDTQWNVTQYVAESAQGGTVNGIGVALNAVDMCPFWCNTNGDGTGHTPAPYFDVVRVMLINASAVAWDVSTFDRFQDNFPEAGTGKVRIDSCNDVGPIAGSTVVIGDSTMVELNMDLLGGIKTTFNGDAGENRPEFYLWFRVPSGPHAGTPVAAMADPDGSDGIFSPWTGLQSFAGESWGTMQADSAVTQGNITLGKYAFDFADNYFEPGDVIEFFYRAEAVDGTISTRPAWAMSTDPALRSTYVVRCLPTAGASMLFCDDANGAYFWWDEAFRYNGYTGYDTYLTQAPSSGLENGLGGRAEIGDLDQYDVIVWDSGGVPSGAITTAADDKTHDDELLTDFMENSTHDTYLWVMGDLIANDLGNGEPFLSDVLGASLLSATQYYDDFTGNLVPKTVATHPALEVGGLTPYFWVDGGCPSLDNFSAVAPSGNPLSVESHAWEDDGGTAMVAGIFNRDPDGNGLATSAGGHLNHVLFNPFSYVRVRDAGFGLGNNFDYARRMVGDVLSNLFSYQPNTSPDGVDTVPAHSALRGNYPNPFNPTTTIKFALATNEHVHLNVYDLSGRLVRTLVDEPMVAADHEVLWDGKDQGGSRAASGVYFYKLTAGDFTATEKMVLLK